MFTKPFDQSGFLKSPPTLYRASAVTCGVGTPAGTIAGVQDLSDGSVYQVNELAATPGFSFFFTFTGVEKFPQFILMNVFYAGSATHVVDVGIWNFVAAGQTWCHHIFYNASYAAYTVGLPYPATSSFRDIYARNGTSYVTVHHPSAGNAAHDIYVDFIGLLSVVE